MISELSNLCKLPFTRTIKFGMESISFRGSLLWNNLNDEIKELPTVASFKQRPRPGRVKHVLAKLVNSLPITSRSLYIFLRHTCKLYCKLLVLISFFFELRYTNCKECL